MDFMRVATNWNAHYGDKLRISTPILELTYGAEGRQKTEVLKLNVADGRFEILCKVGPSQNDEKILRVHLPVPEGAATLERDGAALYEFLLNEAKQRECKKIIFGGGDGHLFPGVPLHKDLGLWLRWIFPSGPEVVDFGGEISELSRKSRKTRQRGELRNCKNPEETQKLLDFVLQEFPGRWSRDLLNDARKNLLNFYFGYFIDGGLAGYVRLYGWSNDYWGPGTYFALPGDRSGGLGPIGVAASRRGHGLGGEILDQSWGVLMEKGCSTVRVDWTTEINFYQKRGLEIVQRYQPASMDL
jgi:GNAT superfamily N-acetyltransferase